MLQAAEAAARKKAEREAAEAAARVATAAAAAAATREAEQRRALWNQAVSQQWHGLEPPRPVSNQGGQEPDAGASSLPQSSSTMAGGEGATSPSQGAAAAAQGGAGVDAATAAAVAAAQLEFERDIRQQQDREYQQSLERDRARKAQQEAQRRADEAALRQLAQQRQLAALRQTLQADLPPEPPSSDPALTLRVRLPGGANASRRFRPSQGFEEVFAWVYGLGDMPLWPPGSWALVSSFPRRQLAPPSSSQWAPGVWEQQQQQGQGVQEEVLLPGEWLLRVNRLTEGPLWVKVHADTTVQEVKDSIMAQTGGPRGCSQRGRGCFPECQLDTVCCVGLYRVVKSCARGFSACVCGPSRCVVACSRGLFPPPCMQRNANQW